MIRPTAAVLHESLLVMKHTPSDISRITDALLTADDRTLKVIPRQAYQHYFDEVGIAMLNWMGRGQTDSIKETLDNLTHSVFSHPEMKQLPDLTTKQRIGLQLRVMCAQMTLYLKVQTATSYNAILVGTRNEVRRTVLRALYESMGGFGGFSYDAFDYQTIWRKVLPLLPENKTTSDKNIHHHLRELVNKGLVIEERSGGSVQYRLSDRGLLEARFHFEEQPEPEPGIGVVEPDHLVAEPQATAWL